MTPLTLTPSFGVRQSIRHASQRAVYALFPPSLSRVRSRFFRVLSLSLRLPSRVSTSTSQS